MSNIRLSYTYLKLLEQNRIDDLINSYFKTGEKITTYQMEEGLAWEKTALESLEKTGKLSKEFSLVEMRNPKPQHRIQVPYMEGFDLVAVLDIFDVDTIFELKTGSSMDSGDYCNEKQVGLYMLACEIEGTPVDKAVIIHYDQMLNKTDMSLVWKTNEILEETTQWVDSLAPKMKQLFEEKGLL